MGMCMSREGEGSWESQQILLGGGGGKKTSTSTSAAYAAAKVVSMKGDLHEYKVPIVVSQVLQTEYSISTCSSSSSSCKNNISDDDRKGYFICNSDLLLYDEYIPAMDSNAHLHPNILYFVLPTSKLNYRLSASDMAALAVKATLALQSTTQLITNSSNNNNSNNVVMNKNKKKKKINQISPVLIMSLSDTNTRPSDHDHDRHLHLHHNDVDVDQGDIDYANDDHHHAIYNIKRLDANAKSHINYKPPSSPSDHDIRVGYSPRSASSNFGVNRSFLKYSSSSSSSSLLRRPKQLSAASNSNRLRLTTIYEGIVLF